MVIFVHELGHFLVAKLCGVKCEKFYLGFDIGGLKLWKCRWGETEYGIGILPLGGYVKMLGQEDNPSRIREETERAKARTNDAFAAVAGGQSTSPETASDSGEAPTPNSQLPPPDSDPAVFDPRSYLAKSVPKRMAIISAGVVMNVLFAWFTAVWAYWIGLDEVECSVGPVTPGAPAWQANLKVGDRITHIRGKPVDRYKDLRAAVSVGDIEGGVPLVIQRPGVAQPVLVTVQPRQSKGIPYPTIGVHMPLTPVLDPRLPVIPATPAAAAQPALAGGDRIVAIDGQTIDSYAQIHRMLALHPEKTLSVAVERSQSPKGKAGQTEAAGPVERITTAVAPAPVRDLGMTMTLGEITAIQGQSPAEEAGILPGDRITHLDGQPAGDPLTIPNRLRTRAWQETGASVTVRVVRPGLASPLDMRVKLRRPDWFETPLNAVPVPALGIAYAVMNSVATVEADGPAARAGLRPGDVIVHARLTPPDKESVRQLPFGAAYVDEGLNKAVTVDLQEEPRGWPAFFEAMQLLLPGGSVELTLADRRVVSLEPVAVPGRFHPKRGFSFEVKTFFSGGQSLAVALSLGTRETIDSLTLVYRFLSKLGTQVSPKAFGGPISIVDLAYHSASQGFADLLMFLTIMGANLAVINFLPIPILDGGHMVFLAYEGVTGKPPNERVQVTLTYLGLLFVLGLMLWVLWLDIVRYASALFDKLF
jgi:regulator of sigma E protease